MNEEILKLNEKRIELENRIKKAQAEIDSAKANQRKTGEFSDPLWFAELKRTIREGTTELHGIYRELKELRQKMPRGSVKARNFMMAAKEILSEEEYQKI